MKLSGNQLPLPATLEEHKEYLHKIVRLKLFFLHHWLSEHPDEDFRHAIRCRVDIYRKTDANPLNWNPSELFWNSEKWLCMEERAYGIYTANKNNRDNFEAEAFEVFRPSIDARCRRDYEDSSRLDGFQCGSLRHGIGVGKNGENSFHIANAVAPHSIFDLLSAALFQGTYGFCGKGIWSDPYFCTSDMAELLLPLACHIP